MHVPIHISNFLFPHFVTVFYVQFILSIDAGQNWEVVLTHTCSIYVRNINPYYVMFLFIMTLWEIDIDLHNVTLFAYIIASHDRRVQAII